MVSFFFICPRVPYESESQPALARAVWYTARSNVLQLLHWSTRTCCCCFSCQCAVLSGERSQTTCWRTSVVQPACAPAPDHSRLPIGLADVVAVLPLNPIATVLRVLTLPHTPRRRRSRPAPPPLPRLAAALVSHGWERRCPNGSFAGRKKINTPPTQTNSPRTTVLPLPLHPSTTFNQPTSATKRPPTFPARPARNLTPIPLAGPDPSVRLLLHRGPLFLHSKPLLIRAFRLPCRRVPPPHPRRISWRPTQVTTPPSSWHPASRAIN